METARREANRSGIEMIGLNELKDDPFFRPSADGTWNACIGKQGTEENYLDGYIDAATELVTTVINKRMTAKRDTIVLPVLYTARHAIELVLKFAIHRFEDIGALSGSGRLNHDINTYFDLLEAAHLGDERIRNLLSDLKPFVVSLARLDSDGQGLRYHQRRDGTLSLSDYSLANLETIRDALAEVTKVMSSLRDRIEDFTEERTTNSHTDKLSRRDLMAIAKELPHTDHWRGILFRLKKALIKGRFDLSDDQFCTAINVIKSNREMKALVGETTSLQYLNDDLLISVAEQWRRLHPRRATTGGVAAGIVRGNGITLQELIEDQKTRSAVILAVKTYLTDQQIAELAAMFSLGKNGGFPEFHEDKVERIVERLKTKADRNREITDVLDKTNLLDVLVSALRRLGRPALAERLRTV